MATKTNRAAVLLGSLGGKAGTGKAKARTTEQARRAALIGWEARRKKAALPSDVTKLSSL